MNKLKTVLLLMMILWLLPFVWTVSLSIGHYQSLFENRLFLFSLRNSVIVACATAVVVVFLASWAAFHMTRTKLMLTQIVLILALIVSLYPHVTIAGPLFLAFSHLT